MVFDRHVMSCSLLHPLQATDETSLTGKSPMWSVVSSPLPCVQKNHTCLDEDCIEMQTQENKQPTASHVCGVVLPCIATCCHLHIFMILYDFMEIFCFTFETAGLKWLEMAWKNTTSSGHASSHSAWDTSTASASGSGSTRRRHIRATGFGGRKRCNRCRVIGMYQNIVI